MAASTAVDELTFQDRLDALRATKLAQTAEKQRIIGAMNHDDWALVLPPEEYREVVETISGSGVPVTDVRIKDVPIITTGPDGAFFGPKACGFNFKALMDAHPPYVDPMSALAGAYMANFFSYRTAQWDPAYNYDHLKADHLRYGIVPGIGAPQHFCQDLAIGLEIGYGGLLDKIARHRSEHPEAVDFYDGLEAVVRGIQGWIARTAAAAAEMAVAEPQPQLRRNLEELAAINAHLVEEPPRTFREACQWILWFQMAARMYNGSGSLGRLDVLLTPYMSANPPRHPVG
jgi:formate C-acetyltransferase